jgi:hypothetical protein
VFVTLGEGVVFGEIRKPNLHFSYATLYFLQIYFEFHTEGQHKFTKLVVKNISLTSLMNMKVHYSDES